VAVTETTYVRDFTEFPHCTPRPEVQLRSFPTWDGTSIAGELARGEDFRAEGQEDRTRVHRAWQL
jgi:hypothetical protein